MRNARRGEPSARIEPGQKSRSALRHVHKRTSPPVACDTWGISRAVAYDILDRQLVTVLIAYLPLPEGNGVAGPV